MRTKSRAQNWSGVSGFETNYKHLSTWLCLTFFATLSCGGRTLDTGGETSFLTCETDDDCATACVDGRCTPATGNVVGTPSATTEDETTTSQGTVTTPAVSASTSASSGSVETTSSDVRGGATTSAPTDGTTSTDAPERNYELIDGVEETYESTQSGFLWSKAIGNWFTYSEDGVLGDSARLQFDPPRGENNYAYWVGGDPAVLDLSAQLMHPQGTEVDLSGYAGISFWARGTGTDLRFGLAVNASALFQSSRGSEVSQWQLPITDEWQQFDVTFEDLASGTSISTIDFLVNGSAGPFEVWVDDVSLICDGACPNTR